MTSFTSPLSISEMIKSACFVFWTVLRRRKLASFVGFAETMDSQVVAGVCWEEEEEEEVEEEKEDEDENDDEEEDSLKVKTDIPLSLYFSTATCESYTVVVQ